jgi:hypothetical protein
MMADELLDFTACGLDIAGISAVLSAIFVDDADQLPLALGSRPDDHQQARPRRGAFCTETSLVAGHYGPEVEEKG